MKPTSILKEEHRMIERAIVALERASDELGRGREVEPAIFADAVDFIRNFADRCHHAKEEGLLFKRMVARGLPANGGPIAVMLAEHDEGRSYVRGLAEALDRYQRNDRSAIPAIASNARNYGSLLLQHIQKEDQILYPMADRVFSENDQQDLLEQFERVEEETVGHDEHERLIELVQKMETEVAALKEKSR